MPAQGCGSTSTVVESGLSLKTSTWSPVRGPVGVLRPTQRKENPMSESFRSVGERAPMVSGSPQGTVITPRKKFQHRLVRTVVAVVGAMALTVGAVAPVGAVVGAGVGDVAPAPPADSPAATAGLWLARQINAEGFVPSPFFPGPDVSGTRDIALALAVTGVNKPAFDRAMAWMAANADLVAGPPDARSVGSLAYLIMILDATGGDPTAFAGINLVAELESSLGVVEDGLYGAGDPTFDGVFRQGLVLAALSAVDADIPSGAIEWLDRQQCEVGSEAPGAFMAYREPAGDTLVGCTAPDPVNFSGAELDATAMAIIGLTAAGEADGETVGAARGWLADNQSNDGGFDYFPSPEASSPNSTSVAVMAIVALGEDPAGDQWTNEQGNTPVGGLLGWQLGCDDGSDAAGAFASPFSGGAPDVFATRQAALGVAGVTLPVGPRQFSGGFDDVLPCSFFTEPVAWANANGITTGIGGSATNPSATFAPAQSVNRAQAITMLWRWAGEPEPAPGATVFTDIRAGGVSATAASWAAGEGITTGVGGTVTNPSTTFDPGRTLNRAQLFTLLWRAADEPAGQGDAPFTDVDSGAFFAAAASWARQAGLTFGVGGTAEAPTALFAPSRTANRAQLVTTLFRFDQLNTGDN